MLYSLIPFFVGAFVTAAISYMIDTFMESGMIFERYYKWLLRYHAKLVDPGAAKFYSDDFDKLHEFAVQSFWFKPMGGCIICMNVWLCFISLPITWLMFDLSVDVFIVVWVIAYISVSNYVLRKWML